MRLKMLLLLGKCIWKVLVFQHPNRKKTR